MKPHDSNDELASSIEDLLTDAVSEVHSFNDMTEDERDEAILPFTTYAYKIPASRHRLFPTSRRGYLSICKAGQLWHQNDMQARYAMPLAEVHEHALLSFGDMISGDALAHHSEDEELKHVFKAILTARVEGASRELAQYFPCQIFSEPCKSFSVGPVQFLCLADWLDFVERRAGRPLAWTNIVRWRAEARVPLPSTIDELKIVAGDKFAAVTYDDLSNAKRALEAIGRAYLVATIIVDRRSQARADECARLAATVAIDSMMLALGHRVFQEIRAPLEETTPVLTRRLRQPALHDISEGWRLAMPGILGGQERQNQIIDHTEPLRIRCGEAIAAFISPSPKGAAKSLYRHWFEGMHWMGDAWRSKSDPVALVKIGVALDILTHGGEDHKIKQLACALLKRKEKEVLAGGHTIQKLTDDIYKRGRSQIGHGKRLALGDELPIDLSVAIQFAKDIFLQYIMELVAYEGEDTFESYVRYLTNRSEK
ncbi:MULTISPECIES: hypothetical protein [unclassified Xanthomonas]|uniref:hypothetical protein n=1 Tax=Xanthomonas sp. LMG 9002 TaxID=1591158 RepID=UPI0013700CEC|nr:hypothetical protein [Xanthomonas sp. LMG 9002]MXV05906.1 hypothetical protein [Xanthomonas sp. LMG 9002]